MLDHLHAAGALLTARGFEVHYGTSTGARITYPHVIIEPNYRRTGEQSVGNRLSTIDAFVRVRSVGSSLASALGLQRDVQQILSPGGGKLRLVVPGWGASLRFVVTDLTMTDRDVTITGSDRHPWQALDTYRLISAPQTPKPPEEG